MYTKTFLRKVHANFTRLDHEELSRAINRYLKKSTVIGWKDFEKSHFSLL